MVFLRSVRSATVESNLPDRAPRRRRDGNSRGSVERVDRAWSADSEHQPVPTQHKGRFRPASPLRRNPLRRRLLRKFGRDARIERRVADRANDSAVRLSGATPRPRALRTTGAATVIAARMRRSSASKETRTLVRLMPDTTRDLNGPRPSASLRRARPSATA